MLLVDNRGKLTGGMRGIILISINFDALQEVQERMTQVLQAEGKVGEVLEHIHRASGKRLRPLLVLLTFDLCGGVRTDDVLNVAAGVELVHMASLIHDDIIDNSDLRRGQETVHRRFGAQVAVLVGDKLFAAAFHLFSLTKHREVLKTMTSIIQEMCSGEINQLLAPLSDEEDYWTYIHQKTACLIGGCCRLGAVLAESPSQEDVLQEFGENLGLAFQLTDDVLDYRGVDGKLGKKIGIDFAEKLWTLPTIRGFRRGLIPLDWYEQDFSTIRSVLERDGILDEVWQLAGDYVTKSASLLQRFPISTTQKQLLRITQQIVNREY